MKVKLVETKRSQYPWTLWTDEKRVDDFQYLQNALEVLKSKYYVLFNDLQIDTNNSQTILSIEI